jgi:pectinesterase
MKINFILLFTLFISLHLSAQINKIVVAQDGSGNYTTIQQALNAIPCNNTKPVVIFVKKGIYKERLILDSGKQFVSLVGENKNDVVVSYNNHSGLHLPNGDTINTWTSASFFIYASNFTAQNIHFENNAGFYAGQAVALYVYGDKAAFYNCAITGFQDVLFCSGPSSRQYYHNCYIEGTTDFIFGPATAVFDSCTIYSKKNSHVTAASTPREILYGFVFRNCTLLADSSLHNVSLGRPWQPYASVTYIHCYIDKHIIPQGWNNWKNPANEKTARFAEFNNYGPGANPLNRFAWIKQLSASEADNYTLKNIFGSWVPQSINY